MGEVVRDYETGHENLDIDFHQEMTNDDSMCPCMPKLSATFYQYNHKHTVAGFDRTF